MNKEENFQEFIDRSKSEKMDQFLDLTTRRRKNGTIYRNRQEMKENYNNSYLPYPLAPLFKLDYCKNVFYHHLKNAYIFSIPITLLSAFTFNKEIKKKGLRAKPFSYYVSLYILVNLIYVAGTTLDCLLFCDYCKPWSDVYNVDNDSEYFKKIVGKINNEKTTINFNLRKTQNVGLKDEEL